MGLGLGLVLWLGWVILQAQRPCVSVTLGVMKIPLQWGQVTSLMMLSRLCGGVPVIKIVIKYVIIIDARIHPRVEHPAQGLQ